MNNWHASVRKEIALLCKTGAQLRERVNNEIREEIGLEASGTEYWRKFREGVKSKFFEDTPPLSSVDETDEWDEDEPREKQRNVHSCRSYHYSIGNHEGSTFFKNFLSDQPVRVPGRGDTTTIRNHTRELSLNKTSSFWCWSRLPLYKVEALAQRFVDGGWIQQSHHCRSAEKLKIKMELLVMGSLASLAGAISSFCQLLLVINICATDHSKFFFPFVNRMKSL
jgi:hypothetical protein